MPPSSFSVTNILGKPPGEPRLEDEYGVDKQIGKGAFGVVRLVRRDLAPAPPLPLLQPALPRQTAVLRLSVVAHAAPPAPPHTHAHSCATGEALAVKSHL